MNACCIHHLKGQQWAWGPSAYWKLYAHLKRYAREWRSLSIIAGSNSASDEDKANQESERRAKRRSVIVTGQNGRVTGFSSSSCKHSSRRFGGSASFSRASTTASSFSFDEHILTDDEVNSMLWENEKSVSVDSECVSHCDLNQLKSNEPNEDQIFASKLEHKNGLVFGVLDGHGGSKFGELVKDRLPYYLQTTLSQQRHLSRNQNVDNVESLAENLLDKDESRSVDDWLPALRTYIKEICEKKALDNPSSIGQIFSYISTPLRQLFGTDVMGDYENTEEIQQDTESSIREAFLRLDSDMTDEIKSLARRGMITKENLGVAASGCCALVAYITGDELYVANSGDCRAVLGTNDNGKWSAVQLTDDHTAVANPSEVQRIIQEHPYSENRSCIQYGRLLGRLAPLRALGDIQFKLTGDELQEIFSILPKYQPLPGLKTPPYLTCKPDVFHYKIENRDKFVVMASDGLWDMLSNEEVVQLVGGYLEGRGIDMLKERAMLMGIPHAREIYDDKEAFADTANENAASFLVRFALNGYDRVNLHNMMTIPYPDVRMYRDDISITVIFFKDDDHVETAIEQGSF